MAYLDSRDRRFFSAAGNNSGAWTLGGSPTPTLQTVQNSNNRTGMSGTRFWMYCGEKDFDHGYPMCDEMVQARTWVQTYGGTVQTLYRDPTGTHGGLTRNAGAIDQMFSYFGSLP